MKRFLSIIALSLVASLSMSQEEKPMLIYIFDPVCGWCYTFNPVIEKVHAKYKHKLDFAVMSGGMMVGKHVRPISDLAEFILAGHKDMENLTGVKFGDKYLEMVEKGTEILDSEKPSFAVTAIKFFHPDKILEFSHELQNAHFFSGMSFNSDTTYIKLAQKYEIGPNDFLQKMNSDTVKALTRADFKRVEDAGIGSFPTVLLKINGKIIPVTEGFEKYEKIEKKLEKILKSEL